MMINTTGTANNQQNGENEKANNITDTAANGAEEGENYEQEALNYLSLALQIIGDFKSSSGALSGDDMTERKRIIAFLEIDTFLSRVQLFNHAPDYKSALEDLATVKDLCTEFPEKNESTMTSAMFQMGRCEMELSNVDAALAHFVATQTMLKVQLTALTLAASSGAASETQDKVEEMVKPSIFDTDEIKRVKSIMIEV